MSGPHADGKPVTVFSDVWLEQRSMLDKFSDGVAEGSYGAAGQIYHHKGDT